MTSRGTITSRTVYRRGGQLTLVFQYDVFFSCFYASCVVRGKGKGKRKECEVRVGRRALRISCVSLIYKIFKRGFLHDSKRADNHLYLEVVTRLSSSGICRLVVLSRPSMAIPITFALFLSPQTVPGLLQDHMIEQFICGTFRQGSVSIS